MRPTRAWIGIPMLLLLALAFTGCGRAGDSVGTDSGHSSLAAPLITLTDTAPSLLDAGIAVTFGGYDAASQGTATIHVGFQYNAQTVKMVGDERVRCADVDLHRLPGYFELQLPAKTVAGTMLHCTYTSAGRTATLALTVPALPAILAPVAGAQVPRSSSLAIQYTPNGQPAPGIVALGTDQKAIAHVGNQPGTASVDTMGFHAGPGTIALTQFFAPLSLHADGFKSASSRGQAMQVVALTWI